MIRPNRLGLALFAAVALLAHPVWGQKRLRGEFYPGPQPPAALADIKVPDDTNPDPKSLEYGEAEVNKARALTRQLGSRDYKERETAARELGKLGRAGVIALKEARATDSNPEVRLRTDILLPRAESDDMRARVYCFLADKDGKYEHKLPGWTQFKALAGSDKASRELFTEVLRKPDYHTLLMACEMSANDLSAVLTKHYQSIQNRQNFGTYTQPSAAEMAVLTFLECQYPEKETPIQGMWGPMSVGNFLYHPEVQNAMRNGSGKYGEPLRRLVTKWMDTRETGFGIQTAMNLAQNWQMKDYLRYAVRIFGVSDPNQQWAKANAAQQIANKFQQRDGKEEVKKYLPAMVKGLDDGGLLQNVFIGGKNPNDMINVLTQDYILGLLCHMTGQKPTDYGLDLSPNSGNNIQNYANWCFRETDKKKAEEKREAGIKKFKAWAEKNLTAESVTTDEPKKGEKKDAPKKSEPKTGEPKQEPAVDLPLPVPVAKPPVLKR